MAVRGAYLGVGPAGRSVAGVSADVGLRASVASSMGAKLAELVTLLLLATVVPRALGSYDYGRFAVPLTIVTLGSLAMSLGGPTLMVRFVPAAAPPDRVALARAIGLRLAGGRAVQLATITALAVVAVVWDGERFPPLETALVVGALAASVAASLALQVPLGLGRTVPWALRYPLQNAVLIVAVLVLHPLAGTVGGVVAVFVSAVAGAVYAWVVAGPVLRARVARVPVPAGVVRFGALQAAGAALVQVVHRGGVVAVAVLGGTSVETGYAALATGIALGVLYAVLQAFVVSLPHLSSADRAAGAAEPEAVLRRLAATLLAVLLPGAALGAVLLDVAVPAVFGDGYAGAVPAFGPALALVVLAPLHALVVQAAALRMRPAVALANGVAAFVVFVAVVVVAVPAWDAAGATTAAVAAAAAGAAVSMRLLSGAVGARLAGVSFGGAAAVLALAALA
jgi:O-antigen/teichoic acid export membrane protein